jgi:hypothetical protein
VSVAAEAGPANATAPAAASPAAAKAHNSFVSQVSRQGLVQVTPVGAEAPLPLAT